MASWMTGTDPTTLRESIDPRLARRRLAEIYGGDQPDAIAERVTIMRCLGMYDEALTEAGHDVHEADLSGDPERRTTARVRLALVHDYRSEHPAAMMWIRAAVALAPSQPLAAFVAYHEGRIMAATDVDAAAAAFTRSLEIRREYGAAPALLAASQLALNAMTSGGQS